MNLEQKLKKAQEAKAKIEKDLGKGTVMSLSDSPDMDIEVVSTGSLGLDIALGVGGLPYGRIVEIYGEESSGKTTLATHVIAEAQKQGDLCAIIDAEHAFDKVYAEALGVKLDMLDICQPDSGEQGLEVADRLIESGAYGVVLIDSVAALVPQAELEGEMGESKMGLHARLMGQALRKTVGKIKKTNTLVIFINQMRQKIGVLFGDPSTTTGGLGLRFYSSVRLSVSRSTTMANSVMEGDMKMGNQTKVKVIKNKVAPPFRECEFDILYGKGIDKTGELVAIAMDLGIIVKGGSWFTYGEIKLQGLDTFKQFLEDNEEVKLEIEAVIKEKFNIK